jgi:hypothetical protein
MAFGDGLKQYDLRKLPTEMADANMNYGDCLYHLLLQLGSIAMHN